MATIRDYVPEDAERVWALLEQGLAAYGIAPDACSTDSDLEDVEGQLLDDALLIARATGFRTMTLETNHALVEAIGLYASYGFVDVSRTELSARCDRAMTLSL